MICANLSSLVPTSGVKGVWRNNFRNPSSSLGSYWGIDRRPMGIHPDSTFSCDLSLYFSSLGRKQTGTPSSLLRGSYSTLAAVATAQSLNCGGHVSHHSKCGYARSLDWHHTHRDILKGNVGDIVVGAALPGIV